MYVMVALPSGNNCFVIASPIIASMGLVGVAAGFSAFCTSVRIVYFSSALMRPDASDTKHSATNTFFIESPPGTRPVYTSRVTCNVLRATCYV